MRITIIHAAYYYSGSEKSVELLARWLISNGHEVNIISVGRYSAPDDLKAKERNILPNADKALTLKALLPIVRVMRYYESNTDIYHIYNVFPMAAAGLYKLLGGKKPVIATLNNYAGFCPSASAIYNECTRLSCRIRCLNASFSQKNIMIYPYGIIYPLLTYLSKKLDKYIAISSQVRDIYIRYNYDKDKIIVIPNFIPLEPTFKYNNYNKNYNNVYTRLLYVGTLSRHKGVDLLLHALDIIKNKYGYNNIKLTIAGRGDDDYEEYCDKLVGNLNLASEVKFIGYVNGYELTKLYIDSDIFIHPARWHEPFGRTIIEALSYGLPVIVSDAISKDIIDESSMLVFRNNDVNDLVDKILLLVNNKDLIINMGRNAYKTISKYDINVIGNKIINVYEELVYGNNR